MAQGPAATFHVYVDPIFGDDAMAFHLNPGAAGSPISRQPMARYPANFPEPGNQTDGFLQHAPYSFRTLSGGQPPGSGNFGALSYLATVFPGNGPWVNEDTGEAVHWIVIHCLPGLYGPVTEDGEFDIVGTSNTFASHFRFNGEVFPIDLRNRVNIQGTSALDTVFDARDTATAIFRAWDPLYNGPTFVDSLTVRGARSDNGEVGEGPNRNDSGAAFSIRRWNSENAELRNSLTISNCFIVENDVGIAIENDVFPEGDDQVATPVIVNNTIAWNTIGIWSGNTDASQPGIGVAQPVILNNIIDPGHPDLGNLVSFLGVHPWDLSVVLPAGITAMNAYPDPATYVGVGAVSNFPALDAGLRAPVMPFLLPRVDLAPYMPTGQARGVLYVSDAFRVANPLPNPPLPELWYHDFRLAPHTVQDPATIGLTTPITELNPLVNMGMSLGGVSGLTQIVMANHVNWWRSFPAAPVPLSQVLLESPGLHPNAGDVEPDRFDAWDWDCEGFGNPRVRARDGFANWSPMGQVLVSNIDLGADEMDELIIAGYRPNTRMFARSWLFLGPDITRLYFFDLRVPPTGPTHPRPLYNYWLGLDNQGLAQNWWQHTLFPNAVGGQCLDCVSVNSSWAGVFPSNYTDVGSPTPSGALRWIWMLQFNPGMNVPPPPGGQAPIMRNLECDFSPTLMSDLHPYWGATWMLFAGALVGANGDFFGSNPWFGTQDPNHTVVGMGLRAPVDNWYLYRSPTYPNLFFRHVLVDGTLNPPGSWRTLAGPPPPQPPDPPEVGSLQTAGFLASPPAGQLGPFGCTPSTTYTVGPFGFGDSACPNEVVPLITDWLGIRFNCQVFENPQTGQPPRSNLQTLLIVVADAPSGSGGGGDGLSELAASRGVSRGGYPGPRVRLEDLGEMPGFDTRLRSILERSGR